MKWDLNGVINWEGQMGNKKKGEAFTIARHSLILAGVLILSTLSGCLFRFLGFPETNIVIIYLLGVVIAAWLSDSFVVSTLASVFATALFNYFFTEPYFTFSVNDPSYIMTFFVMTITALITCMLTVHAKQSATAARQRESETKAVYTLTNYLTDAVAIQDIAGAAISVISKCLNCQAACLCFIEGEEPEPYYVQRVSDGKQIRREVENPEELKNRIKNLKTDFAMSEEFYDWPVWGRESILGLIRLPREDAEVMNEAQTRLLQALLESTGLAMDRLRASELRVRSRKETETGTFSSQPSQGNIP